MKRSENLIYSENETVYKGVLEYFQVFKPDILVTFKRERGFFEKLWEPDIIYKKDFYGSYLMHSKKLLFANQKT